MGKRVILHVGTMKTGTSFVQSILTRHPDELAAAGALFLGGNRRFYDQTRASRDLLKLPQKPKANLRKWRALAEQARTTDAETSIISMEFLSFLGPEQVRLAVEELAGLEVRMLLTVRDQRSAIPAQWQTYVRNYGTDDWGRYLGRIQAAAGRSRARKTFHRAQGVATILDRWGSAPGVDGVDVVTVPPPGGPKEELWNRFCDAAGIEVGPVDVEGVRANPSVGYASCDFLRQLNAHLEDVRPKHYRKAIRPLAVGALVPLRGEESRPELDRRAAAWALERNQQVRTAIAAGGYRLVGDLADIPVDQSAADLPRGVAPVPPEQVLRAARAAWAHAAEQAGESTATPPETIDKLVAECARLLHVAHGWNAAGA